MRFLATAILYFALSSFTHITAVSASETWQQKHTRAKVLLAQNHIQQAVELLESSLSRIDGDREYLDTLRQAYRSYLQLLVNQGESQRAQIYLRRLQILEPSSRLPSASAQRLVPYSVREQFRITHPDQRQIPTLTQIVLNAWRNNHNRWFRSETLPNLRLNPIQIFIYPTAQQYSQATFMSRNSPGHTSLSLHRGRILYRKVYVRADFPNYANTTVPHELLHAQISGLFGNRHNDRWFDEGMAVLCESQASVDHHLRGLARQQRLPFSARQLMELTDYPPKQQLYDFYRASTLLTKYMAFELGNRTTFFRFLRSVMQSRNYPHALRQVYQIDFARLERGFRQAFLANKRRYPTVSARNEPDDSQFIHTWAIHHNL